MKVADMSAEQKVEYMTTEPIPRLVSQMAVPTIISMLVTSFYNMVDTMFVGRINTQSTAAVGIVFSVMAIIQALDFDFSYSVGDSAIDFNDRAINAIEKSSILRLNVDIERLGF